MPRGVYERTPEMKTGKHKRTPEMNAANSKALTGRTLSPPHCAAMSEASRNSEAVKAHNESMHGVPQSPEQGAKISDTTLGVPHTTPAQIAADKANADKQRGGHDIVNHHYIYDHSDISKYTMKMTRSAHARLHNNMRKSGIKVPHINVTEENKDIFKQWRRIICMQK